MDDAIESLLNQGYLARREGRLADAKDIYAEAVDLCRAAKDQALLALALKRLGGIKRDLHEIDVHEIEAALQDYQEAAAIDRALEDPLNLAHTIRHIGDILREDGKPDAALPCYEEALQDIPQPPRDRHARPCQYATRLRSAQIHSRRNGCRHRPVAGGRISLQSGLAGTGITLQRS
jgi:tetratricopeptide (TPR) repeat protein